MFDTLEQKIEDEKKRMKKIKIHSQSLQQPHPALLPE